MFYSKTICVPDYRNKILHFGYYVSLEDKLALIAQSVWHILVALLTYDVRLCYLFFL